MLIKLLIKRLCELRQNLLNYLKKGLRHVLPSMYIYVRIANVT